MKVQTSYFCSMMNTTLHGDCCCDGANDNASVSEQIEPCCVQFVNIVIDPTADQAQPTAKSIKFESGPDPPQLLALPFELPLEPVLARSTFRAGLDDVRRGDGTATYLLTQRLRI